MLSDECTLSSHHETNWTKEENNNFERLLTIFSDDVPTRYESIASFLPNKTAEQVRMHYEALVFDVGLIENNLVPMPNYRDDDEVVMSTENDNSNNNNNNNNRSPEVVAEIPQKNKRNPECKWTDDEHIHFVAGFFLSSEKGDWRGISRKYVPTKTPTQVASHAQKFMNRQNEQGVKKRKSIHDITVDSPQVQQLIATLNAIKLSEVQQQHDAGEHEQNQQLLQQQQQQQQQQQHGDNAHEGM